jgi:hypothetical protein
VVLPTESSLGELVIIVRLTVNVNGQARWARGGLSSTGGRGVSGARRMGLAERRHCCVTVEVTAAGVVYKVTSGAACVA